MKMIWDAVVAAVLGYLVPLALGWMVLILGFLYSNLASLAELTVVQWGLVVGIVAVFFVMVMVVAVSASRSAGALRQTNDRLKAVSNDLAALKEEHREHSRALAEGRQATENLRGFVDGAVLSSDLAAICKTLSTPDTGGDNWKRLNRVWSEKLAELGSLLQRYRNVDYEVFFVSDDEMNRLEGDVLPPTGVDERTYRRFLVERGKFKRDEQTFLGFINGPARPRNT